MKKIIYSVMMLATMAFTFTSCEDVPLPYGWPIANGGDDNQQETPVDATGTGTAEDPYNVAAALHLISTLGADVNSDYVYTKGIVTSISEISPSYGNATFKISDTADGDNELTIYRAKYLDNKAISSEDQVKIGDEVVIYGQLVNFRGSTPEYTQGCYIYSINGSGSTPDVPGTPTGSGTLNDPYNSVAANEYTASLGADEKSPNDIYIKGKVASITEQYGTQYGNATFYISDDGTSSNAFYVFRALYLNNQKYTGGDVLKVGDEVIVCGKVVNYKGSTPETVQGEAYLYSLNSSGGTGGGGGDKPTPTEGTGDGTEANPYNVAAAISVTSALDASTKSDDVYVTGTISTIKEVDTGQYGNASYYISDDGTTTNEFYIFRGYYLNGDKFSAADQIKVGDKVVLKGKLQNYQGNTPEMAQGNYIVTLTPGSGGGGNTGGGGGGEVSGNTITVDMGSFGLANQAELSTLTLSDGTTLTFATGEGTTSPKFYSSGGFNAARMYAKNSLTINAGSKKITKVVITCTDPYQGTAYNGNEMMYGQAGGSNVNVKKDSDTQVTFSGFSNSTLLIVNDHSEAKGGTQLRIAKMVITYAE